MYLCKWHPRRSHGRYYSSIQCYLDCIYHSTDLLCKANPWNNYYQYYKNTYNHCLCLRINIYEDNNIKSSIISTRLIHKYQHRISMTKTMLCPHHKLLNNLHYYIYHHTPHHSICHHSYTPWEENHIMADLRNSNNYTVHCFHIVVYPIFDKYNFFQLFHCITGHNSHKNFH